MTIEIAIPPDLLHRRLDLGALVGSEIAYA
jgi:hypothetical protein